MKKIFLSLLTAVALLASLSGCEEDNPGKEDTPKSEVPANMVGKWMYGSFNMIQFWNYDGSYDGPGFQLAVVFNFTQDGHYEFYFAAESNSYGCKTDAFTFHKGTVVFNNDNSFTIYPQDGNYRGFYNCAPSSNFNRGPQEGELKPETYIYGYEVDDYNQQHLVIRHPGEENGGYFEPVTW